MVKKISLNSDYYIHNPSDLAKRLYLYPVRAGYYRYESGYYIERNNFDNFWVMFITKGNCDILLDGKKYAAKAGECVFLDCYKFHCYGSTRDWECLWLHFDGILAREYFEEISARYGHVLNPTDSQAVFAALKGVYSSLKNRVSVIEKNISKNITDVLDGLLISRYRSEENKKQMEMTIDCVSYINEHFDEQISVEKMAKMSHMSVYHFTRIFTRETGCSPHQYLVEKRLTAAKHMLKSSKKSIKDIAFSVGFESESGFCSTFKKKENVTPGQYRRNVFL